MLSHSTPPNTSNNKLQTHTIMLVGVLAGISVLFIALTIAYAFSAVNWTWQQCSFPSAFIWSTVVLAMSSYSMYYAQKAFEHEHTQTLLNALWMSCLLSSTFIITQMVGWAQLYNKGVHLAGKPDGSYLYLISGLHILHVLLGIALLFFFTVKAKNQLNDTLQKWLFWDSRRVKNNLQLISIYWHFVDILWIYLLLFFIVNHSFNNVL